MMNKRLQDFCFAGVCGFAAASVFYYATGSDFSKKNITNNEGSFFSSFRSGSEKSGRNLILYDGNGDGHVDIITDSENTQWVSPQLYTSTVHSAAVRVLSEEMMTGAYRILRTENVFDNYLLRSKRNEGKIVADELEQGLRFRQ